MIRDQAQVRRIVTLCEVERRANVCQLKKMKLSERVDLIDRKLNELYPSPPIPLEHKDPFTLLVAVLLSAQCTDARVNKVTLELFSLADNPFDMSRQSVEAINQIVRPCGLAPRKAQAIQGLSEILLSKHEGEVPSTFDELEELPGSRTQNCIGCHDSSLRAPCFSGRHPYSPLSSTMETDERQKRHPNGERPEATLPQRTLEQGTSTNHLLRVVNIARPTPATALSA